jgi:hypothetical protein
MSTATGEFNPVSISTTPLTYQTIGQRIVLAMFSLHHDGFRVGPLRWTAPLDRKDPPG